MRKRRFLSICLIFFVYFSIVTFVFAEESNDQVQVEEKWKSLDEVVIEKIAMDSGKNPKPFVELHGDLELFIFSLLSAIGGFAAGFFYRKIFYENKDVKENR